MEIYDLWYKHSSNSLVSTMHAQVIKNSHAQERSEGKAGRDLACSTTMAQLLRGIETDGSVRFAFKQLRLQAVLCLRLCHLH